MNDTQYDPMSIENDLQGLSEGGELDTFLTTYCLSYLRIRTIGSTMDPLVLMKGYKLVIQSKLMNTVSWSRLDNSW